MRIRKLVTAVTSLCMALGCIAGAAYAEPTLGGGDVTGGWEFSDIAAQNVSEDEQAILNKALEELEGVSYEAVDVIASQVVAGKNLAFLCKASVVSPDAVPYWAIVTVYKDVAGDATVSNIAKIDPADVNTKENADEVESGSWYSEEKENAAEVPESVKNALDMNIGVTLSPIAVLGTQVVAGTNYCVLCYGTTVTAEPVTGLYEVDVYAGLDGNAEITDIAPLDLASYVQRPVEDDPEPTTGEVTADLAPAGLLIAMMLASCVALAMTCSLRKKNR